MEDFPKDIYTEPEPDVDTLANLGPLTGMAGIWTGTRGLDVNPKPDGPEKQAFIEHMELQPIDAQTNGPQLFYGLRYRAGHRIDHPGPGGTLPPYGSQHVPEDRPAYAQPDGASGGSENASRLNMADARNLRSGGRAVRK